MTIFFRQHPPTPPHNKKKGRLIVDFFALIFFCMHKNSLLVKIKNKIYVYLVNRWRRIICLIAACIVRGKREQLLQR